MEVQELEQDCLAISRNRKQLIITSLLIWISPTQSLGVKEKNCFCWISYLPACFLSAGRVFCSFS